MAEARYIRNFSIVAHLAHGKSTLADRLLEMPGADIEATKQQIEHALALDPSEALLISAKQGAGVDQVLEAIVARVPPPKGSPEEPLQALVFDSWYDSYRGVVVLARVVQGTLRVGTRLRLWSNGQVYTVEELGIRTPKLALVEKLVAGEVGYVIANIKRVSDTRIGDTITDDGRPASAPLPGFEEIKPMVFAGLYPVEANQYELLRDALEKLRLNDSSFFYEPENSAALGFGFRCGFLGLLHMEIVQERLEREFNLNLITTAPGVRYRVTTKTGEVIAVESPAKFPAPADIAQIEEPVITALILTNDEFLGGILKLVEEKRGVQKGFEYVSPKRVLLTYELPLNEIVLDFYDRLKSAARGYASLDYHFSGYWESDLVKVDLLVAGDPVDALSFFSHREHAQARARILCDKMRKLIPRQMFEVAIQASIGSRIIARENVPAIRKNVLAKCYGGDISRKRKLLEKQKAGKKRMKRVGRVDIPQEAFLAVLKVTD